MQMEHQSQQHNCQRCGAALVENQRFCRNCGSVNPRYTTPQQANESYEYASSQHSPIQQWLGWVWALVRRLLVRLLALDKALGSKLLRGIIVGSVVIEVVSIVLWIAIRIGGLPWPDPWLTVITSVMSVSWVSALSVERQQRRRTESERPLKSLWEYVKRMLLVGVITMIGVIIMIVVRIIWLTVQFGPIVLEYCGIMIIIMLAVIFWEKIKEVVLVIMVVVLAIAVIGFLILIWSFSPAAVLLILLIAVLIGVIALLRKK